VLRYLSPEWIAALDDEATRAATDLTGDLAGVTLVVEHRVVGAPEGDVAYVVTIRDGDVRVAGGPHRGGADLVLTADYATARALARGDVNAQQAFAAGMLKVAGRIDRLVAASRALAALQDGLAAVRARTTFE
jgi:putative sterol carrier protein